MRPIKMIFSSGETLVVYSDDPRSFSDSVLEAKPPEIRQIEYNENDVDEQLDLVEVKLTLQSGAIILCNLPKTKVAKALYIQEIVDCDSSNAIAYSRMARIESDLDERYKAACTVINNLPDLDVRLYLHKEYMRRKQAYVAAIEALIDGVIRSPNK